MRSLVLQKGGFMKKIVAILLFAIIAGTAFAQNSASGSIAGMIKDGLFKNEARIKDASFNLDATEKLMLYGEFKKDPWVPFIINFLIGAGIGSFVEGDTTGGVIGLTGDVIGLGSILMGVSTYASALSSNPYTTSGLGMVTFGYIALIGTRVFEIIRPFTFSSRYNSTLKGALNYYDGLSLAPIFESGVAGITLSYKIRLN
jgi:hypothetical protein